MVHGLWLFAGCAWISPADHFEKQANGAEPAAQSDTATLGPPLASATGTTTPGAIDCSSFEMDVSQLPTVTDSVICEGDTQVFTIELAGDYTFRISGDCDVTLSVQGDELSLGNMHCGSIGTSGRAVLTATHPGGPPLAYLLEVE